MLVSELDYTILTDFGELPIMHARNKLIHRSPARVLIASILTLMAWAMFLVGLGAAIWGFFDSQERLIQGLLVLVVAVVVRIVKGVVGAPLRCAVCANPVFAEKNCSKHRTAKSFLGLSYAVPVAFSCLCRARFRCIYCGEVNPLTRAPVGGRKRA